MRTIITCYGFSWHRIELGYDRQCFARRWRANEKAVDCSRCNQGMPLFIYRWEHHKLRQASHVVAKFEAFLHCRSLHVYPRWPTPYPRSTLDTAYLGRHLGGNAGRSRLRHNSQLRPTLGSKPQLHLRFFVGSVGPSKDHRIPNFCIIIHKMTFSTSGVGRCISQYCTFPPPPASGKKLFHPSLYRLLLYLHFISNRVTGLEESVLTFIRRMFLFIVLGRWTPDWSFPRYKCTVNKINPAP